MCCAESAEKKERENIIREGRSSRSLDDESIGHTSARTLATPRLHPAQECVTMQKNVYNNVEYKVRRVYRWPLFSKKAANRASADCRLRLRVASKAAAQVYER